MPSSTIQDRVPTRIPDIYIRAMLNQLAHDLGIAASRCVVDRMVTPAVRHCRQMRM